MWFETFVIYSTTILVVTVTAVYLYFKYLYTTWTRVKLPHLEPTFPYGSTKSFLTLEQSMGDTFADIYNKLKAKTKSFGGFYMFSKPVIMIIDPDLIRNILSTNFVNFHDRQFYIDEENDPLGAHLVALKGEKWKTIRAKLTPTFTSGKMKMMFHTILSCSKELASILDDHIKNNEALDMKDIFARLATDTIGSCAFGLDCNSLKDPNTEFRRYGKKVFTFNFRDAFLNILANECPSILKLLKIPLTSPDITDFFMNVLKQTVEYREENNVHRKDFLDLLIRLKNNQSVLDDLLESNTEESEGITFNELAAQAFVFFFAGFETTSTTLNFVMYELVNNLSIQETLRKEINTVLKEHNDELTYEGIMEMKYMTKVINETLRKYPPLPLLARECVSDFQVPDSDFIIKKGTEITISINGLHHNPEYYPEPEKFDPERFCEEQKSARHPYTYLPFGEGPRNCIGMRFAILQVKIVLASVLKDYKFTLDSKTVTPIRFDPKSIFLSPLNTIWLQATKCEI